MKKQRRLINTYIVVLISSHPMLDSEIVKLHELENGRWYTEDCKGQLSSISADIALKLINSD